jgi:hypothetical protein
LTFHGNNGITGKRTARAAAGAAARAEVGAIAVYTMGTVASRGTDRDEKK